MIIRRLSDNKLNINGDEDTFFDKDRTISKEYHVSITPEEKDFWNFMPNEEKSFI